MVQTCCICKTWTSSRFTESTNYEELFASCFGPLTKGRSGKICQSCRKNLNEHKNDKTKTYFDKIDSRDKKHKPKKLERSENVRDNFKVKEDFVLKLPRETWLKILSLVDPKDIVHFRKTSSLAYELSHDNEVWKSLYLRTFGSTEELQFTDDWRSIYVLRYKIDQQNTDLKNKFNHLQDELGQSESTNIKLIETITELKDIVNTLTLKNSLFEKDLESLKHELSHKGLNTKQLSDKLRNLQLVITF